MVHFFRNERKKCKNNYILGLNLCFQFSYEQSLHYKFAKTRLALPTFSPYIYFFLHTFLFKSTKIVLAQNTRIFLAIVILRLNRNYILQGNLLSNFTSVCTFGLQREENATRDT